MSLEEKKLFKLEVEPSMIGIFTSMVLDKIREIDADIETQKVSLEKMKRSIEEAIKTRNRLQNSYQGLISGTDVKNNTIKLEPKISPNQEPTPNSLTKTAPVRLKDTQSLESERVNTTRFWRDKKFLGWRVYVREVLDSSKQFLSLSNFIELTKEADLDERKRLESSISNALTTLLARKQIGTIQVQGFQGRFYGSLSAFQNQWPIESSLTELKSRLGSNPELTDVVYPQQEGEESKAYPANHKEAKSDQSQMGLEM